MRSIASLIYVVLLEASIIDLPVFRRNVCGEVGYSILVEKIAIKSGVVLTTCKVIYMHICLDINVHMYVAHIYINIIYVWCHHIISHNTATCMHTVRHILYEVTYM